MKRAGAAGEVAVVVRGGESEKRSKAPSAEGHAPNHAEPMLLCPALEASSLEICFHSYEP